MGLENIDENFSLNDEDYINNLLDSLKTGELKTESGTVDLGEKIEEDK